MQLQLVAKRYVVLSGKWYLGLESLSRVRDRPQMQRHENEATALVEAQGGDVVVSRDQPDAMRAGAERFIDAARQERARDALTLGRGLENDDLHLSVEHFV